MKFDQDGLILDPTGDGGDSCHLTGLHIMATKQQPIRALSFVKNGLGVRHPTQEVWNYHGNFTRDQLSVLVGALVVCGARSSLRDILKQTLKRLCFAQNFERDCPGTRKYPWPHRARRCKGWDEFEKTQGHWKLLDFADPLFPHYVLAMAAGVYPVWKPFFRAMAMPFFVMDALTYRWSKNDDQGAKLACAYVLDFGPLYKRLVPDWDKRIDQYFKPRGMPELGVLVKNWVTLL